MKTLRIGVILTLVGVYFWGCAVLNDEVRQACWHDNCVHGWYSRYTNRQQSWFELWALGFPVGVLLLWDALMSTKRTSQSSALEITAGTARAGRRALHSARARKSWSCERCDRAIRAGSMYWYHESGYGTYTTRHRFCSVCGGSGKIDLPVL